MADYVSSDAEYAIVASKLDEVADDKFEIDFVGAEGVEVKDETNVKKELNNIIDWFIKYTTSSGKVDSAKKLIDLVEFNELDDEDALTGVVLDPDEAEFSLAKDLAEAGVTKKHLKVKEISMDKDYAAIKYIDEVEDIDDVFAEGTYYVKNYVEAEEYVSGTKYYDEDGTEVTLAPEDGFDAAGTLYKEGFVKLTTGAVYDADVDYYSDDTGTANAAIIDQSTLDTAIGNDEAYVDGYVEANAYAASTEYFELVEEEYVEVDLLEVAFLAGEYYEEELVEADKYVEGKDYFTATGSAATIPEPLTTVGTIRLDEDEITVIDLRDGTVDTSLSLDEVETSGIYVVVYKAAPCDREGNVVVILD